MKKFNVIVLSTIFIGLGLFTSCKEKKEVLSIYNWTYYTPDSILRKFEKEYNCIIKCDYFDSNEVMYSKLKAGAKGYDLTIPSSDYVSIMINQGMLEKIDLSKFPNAKYINPAVLEKAKGYDPDMTWCVPYCVAANGIAVNKTKIKDYPHSYDIFECEEFKGKMTMMDDMRLSIGSALKYLGYSLNTHDEKEIQEAGAYLKEHWLPNLLKFDAESFGKNFASGNYWVCDGYAENIFGEVPEEAQEDTIDFFIPDTGSGAYLDSIVILKGTKHYDLAMKFIDFSHRPENYAEFLDALKFPPYVNTDAAQYTKKKPMYGPELLDKVELKMDVGEDLQKYNVVWQDIRFAL